mmetsp:Transcript_25438/g.37864  ORF Transcript_25438/g.37864 Transcript_25438/m.37864 type:complete len:743 (+) Transcript_25438:28-2256(+)
MVEEITIMASPDVSREVQSAVGDSNIKIEDGELTKEFAAAPRTVSDDTTTISPLGNPSSSSQVEIPSSVAVKAEVSSSSDSSSMPPPPAVIRAAPPSTTPLKATSAATTAGRVAPAAGTAARMTSSPAKQEIKQVQTASHSATTSSIARSGMAPPNPVARTTGLVARPPGQQPNNTAAISTVKSAKLHGKVHGTVYPNPVMSSSADPKPTPAHTSHVSAAQSSVRQYENDIPTSSDISITGNSSGGGSSSKKKTPHPLRRGKWTSEEEAYANRLIGEFKSGLLPLTDGTTLRNFLSKLLNCDPMRISKKFVGNNCIGKQVFRRRVAEINRITTEQMQQTKMELSELERRFLDRVAQTNRVKAPGVSAAIGPSGVLGPLPPNLMKVGGAARGVDDLEIDSPPTPPWLKPPTKYKPSGKFAKRLEAKAKAAAERKAKLAAAAAAAAAATKASEEVVKKPEVVKTTTLMELARTTSNEGISRTESALEQLARTASAAKFVEDIVNGDGSEEAKVEGKKLSQSALRGSFNVLMSMDLQSVENLVELASSSNLASLLTESKSSAQMETFIQSLSSSGNLLKAGNDSHAALGGLLQSLSRGNLLKAGEDSHVALGNLLQSIQTDLHELYDENASSNNLFDPEKFIDRAESVTGFSKLRVKDGISNGGSVEDFLSLMASGDIPHQDPGLLNVPLQKVMQQHGVGAASVLKRKLSQQQLSALASRISRSRLASATANTKEGSALKKQRRA